MLKGPFCPSVRSLCYNEIYFTFSSSLAECCFRGSKFLWSRSRCFFNIERRAHLHHLRFSVRQRLPLFQSSLHLLDFKVHLGNKLQETFATFFSQLLVCLRKSTAIFFVKKKNFTYHDTVVMKRIAWYELIGVVVLVRWEQFTQKFSIDVRERSQVIRKA